MSNILDQRLELSDQRSKRRRQRVLALSSAGGHWIQMLRLQPAFESCDVTYATTNTDYRSDLKDAKFRTIINANRNQKFKLLLSALSILWVILRVWPDVIISTGAAPGFFAIRIGKLFGKKTIWVDSIANAEELSMSGHRVANYADLWLTQWEHLAKPDGPHYFGNVLGDASEQRSSDNEEQKSEVSSQISELRTPNSELRKQKPFRIFVTVGSDVPFDRMVKIIDQWAAKNPEHVVFAQIGRTSWKPESLEYCQILTPIEYTKKVNEADVIVAHAGMGSILTALKHQKTILTMPRLGHLGETRNEHQTATANRLLDLGKINVAFNEDELTTQLQNAAQLQTNSLSSRFAERELTKRISEFAHCN